MKKKKISLLSKSNLMVFKNNNSHKSYNHRLELDNNNNNNKNNIKKNSNYNNCNSKKYMMITILLVVLLEIISKSCLLVEANSNIHATSNNKLAPLYWITNNKKFYESTSENYYLKMNAHLGDSIDLVCPKVNINNLDQIDQNQAHYLTIYKVGSKYEFDNCIINPNNIETVPILKCDKPSVNTRFTIYFVKYSPVPFALEFEEDKEYFFLSTSSGTKDGLNFMTGGLCSKFNMRFSIKINSAASDAAAAASLTVAATSNTTYLKKKDPKDTGSAASMSSQLLSDEDSIILQQLKERIQSTVSSMNQLVNHNNEKSAPEQQVSKSSNLILISKSNNLFVSYFNIYFLLIVYFFLLSTIFV